MLEEQAAFLSSFLEENGENWNYFQRMFWQEGLEQTRNAWQVLSESMQTRNSVFLQDEKERVNNGQSRERGYAETDETTGRGLFRSETPGSNTGRGSEAGEVLSGIRQVYGAEAEGEAQSYGEIGNFAVQDGQTGSTAYLNKYADGF